MEKVRILWDEENQSKAEGLAAELKGHGVEAELVDVSEDSQSHELAFRTGAGLDPLFPLVVVGEPKIRVLIWNASPEDARRLAGAGDGKNGVEVRVYSSTLCPDCRRLTRYLNEKGVKHSEINIEKDKVAMDWVLTRSGGRRVVPSLAVGERTALFNPAADILDRILGLKRR